MKVKTALRIINCTLATYVAILEIEKQRELERRKKKTKKVIIEIRMK